MVRSARRGPPINDVGSTQFPKICIWGVSGVGKTNFLGSAGELTPDPNNEYGASCLILRPPTDHTDTIYGQPGLKEWVIPDWSEMLEVENYLAAEGHTWRVVCLDSISLWEEMGLDDVWEAAKRAKPSRAAYGRDKPEYGIHMQRMDEWLRHIVTMDKFTFLVTALPMIVADKETGEETWMPQVLGKDGKRSHNLCGYMNIVGNLVVRKSKGKVIRVLYTQQDGDHYAKDQYRCFPTGRLPHPTIPKLFDAIEAAKASKVAAVTTTQPKKRRTTNRRNP